MKDNIKAKLKPNFVEMKQDRPIEFGKPFVEFEQK